MLLANSDGDALRNSVSILQRIRHPNLIARLQEPQLDGLAVQQDRAIHRYVKER
jgi:hypothetical protein